VTWCGSGESQRSRQPDLQLTSAKQVHVVYAIPSDAPDDFAAQASGIATDIAAIDAWWRGQDPTRTPRFDLYPFPNCGSTFGDLDLGFVRLPRTESEYEQVSSLTLIEQDLASVLSIDEKTLVYFNGAFSDHDICGISRGVPTTGGSFGLSLVLLRSDCGELPLGAGVSATVAAHELTHNLGAVPSEAPNECQDEPGHVCDSTLDLLYPFLAPGFTLDQAILDVNHDDYYAHSGNWWDVQDSAWLSHLPQFGVSVGAKGRGSVALTTAGGVASECRPMCTGSVDGGSTVQLLATPEPGFVFAGWSGSCSGRAACTLANVGAAITATATFVPGPQTLTVRLSGRGRVTSRPTGISCPGSCTHAFAYGKLVRLAAAAAKGWRFAGWAGRCRGTGACTVPTDRARIVSARFARI
jgi:hypothetical protein